MRYVDVYTVPKYSDRVSDIKIALDGALSSEKGYLESTKSTLKAQLDAMKVQEKALFALLNVSDINELNMRIKKYENIAINFTGERLYSTILKEFDIEKTASDKKFEDSVYNFIYNTSDGQKIQATLKQEGAEAALAVINNVLGLKGKYKLKSTAGLQSKEILPLYFTSAQKKDWRDFLAKDPSFKFGTGSIKQNGDSISFIWKQNITNDGKLLSALDAQKLGLSDNQIDTINKNIKNALVQDISDSRLKDVIDYMINKDKYLFFVGNNINEITGLVGEMMSLFYFYCITDKIDDRWTGQFTVDGKKPPVDIIFDQFGIQVKNTAQEILGKVDFSKASLKLNLSRIDLPSDIKEIITTYGATKKFNIPYTWEYENGKRIYKKADQADPRKGRGGEFNSLRAEFESYSRKIDQLLTIGIAAFLHMDYGQQLDNAKSLSVNSLYQLGTKSFVTASMILEDAIKDLEKEISNLSFHFSLLNSAKGHNIVDALNNGDFGKNTKYTDDFIDSLSLTTSYNFSHFQ